ncbi:MAG: hypothetical protein ACJ75B_18585, partial [Flavisolibacter sp.]
PTDLIWIEGESRHWSHPTEIDSLRSMVSEEKKSPTITKKPSPKHDHYISVRMSSASGELRKESHASWPMEPEIKLRPLPLLKERIQPVRPKKQFKRKKFRLLLPLIQVAAFFFGLLLGVLVIKKLVDAFTPDSPAEEESSIEFTSAEKPAATHFTEIKKIHAQKQVLIPRRRLP